MKGYSHGKIRRSGRKVRESGQGVYKMSATEIIRKRYDRTARFYDCMDFMIREETRKRVIEMAHGRVLEVGVGTGKNLRFYPAGCEVTGIDFSPGMLRRAEQRAREISNITLMEMDVQDLKFPDNSFDTIVATCVFCSVPDPVRGLEELRRVCKPDGQLLFLEHIRSTRRLLGLMMDLFNPLTVRIIGSNINRRTLDNMKAAGLHLKAVDTISMEILKLVAAQPNK